ncbi:DUF3775 domain-containing protein [Sphingomonas quercus]|uniref:DUF3775 domain-containing protein n=1 Tax=Sphingomonas quercus TaxID=2842451 RepID=UPI00341A3F33
MALDLSISLETICRLIIRGREMEAQVPGTDPDNEDEPDDVDDEFAVLDDDINEAVEEEMRSALEDLADDQIAEVLALALIGRGTYDASEWDEALEAANDPDAEDPVERLLEMPMLSAYLDSGLAAFDLSCEGIGQID